MSLSLTGALRGVCVLEVPGRLASRVCGSLLARMGAEVQVHDHGGSVDDLATMPARILAEGKQAADLGALSGADALRMQIVIGDASVDAERHALLDRCLGESPLAQTLCLLSTSGWRGGDAQGELGELALQARAGLMGVTGEEGGAPMPVRAPVAEMLGGLVAATATLAAWRWQRLGGAPQVIDLSLLEVLADQLRTQASLVIAGKRSGYRVGTRHPVCAPWNAYRASDGWVVICSASDAQWRALAGAIDDALVEDSRFLTVEGRRHSVDALDAAIEQWTRERTVEAIIAAVTAVAVPAGPVATVEMMHRRARCNDRTADGVPDALRSPVRYTPFDPVSPARPDPVRPVPASPLSGVRVIELSRYAAGPIAGSVLASLGAEVIKIEAPGGEDCRQWTPRFGDTSGYFANYNAGKRSVVLDLTQSDARAALWRLIDSADVLLSNLRPGVIDRLGFDPASVQARRPDLVQAEISGYGRAGVRSAALDTVIQAQSGLLSLVGRSARPVRVGLSIADQVAGHFAAQGILAALERCDREGGGGLIDVPMIDAATWLTLATWPDGQSAMDGANVLQASDGWVAAMHPPDAALVPQLTGCTVQAMTQRLAAHGMAAYPVNEPGAVFDDPVLAARGSVYRATHDSGVRVPLLCVPLGLTITPALRAERIPTLGSDHESLLGKGVP